MVIGFHSDYTAPICCLSIYHKQCFEGSNHFWLMQQTLCKTSFTRIYSPGYLCISRCAYTTWWPVCMYCMFRCLSPRMTLAFDSAKDGWTAASWEFNSFHFPDCLTVSVPHIRYALQLKSHMNKYICTHSVVYSLSTLPWALQPCSPLIPVHKFKPQGSRKGIARCSFSFIIPKKTAFVWNWHWCWVYLFLSLSVLKKKKTVQLQAVSVV